MRDTFVLARYGNIILGIWLFLSTFLWRHTQAQATNTWITGLLCAIIAAVSLRVPQARYLNALLAIWVLVAAWALPSFYAGTVWHNTIVAILIFALALVPGYAPKRRGAVGPGGPTES